MNKTVKIRLINRIMLALFVLLFVSIVTFSIIGLTFADEAHSSEHILSYNTNSLTWNEGATGIQEDGTYSIDLFGSLPVGEDGMKIIAPGAHAGGSLSLLNTTSHILNYTAAIFLVTDSGVPITADFSNFDFDNTVEDYVLPSDFEGAEVLRAVSGKLDSYASCKFIVEWEWAFSIGDEEDLLDTEIGNLEFSELSIGVIVTVSDSMALDGVITPDPPACTCFMCLFDGGCAMCWLCHTIMILIIILIVFLIIGTIISFTYKLWSVASILASLFSILLIVFEILMFLL